MARGKEARIGEQSGLKDDTPQMPFRRISRSLSVTGGRPSRERLTSNQGVSYSQKRDQASLVCSIGSGILPVSRTPQGKALRVISSELREKHWFPAQLSTDNSQHFKELLAQLRTHLTSQSLTNPRVCRIDFVAC